MPDYDRYHRERSSRARGARRDDTGGDSLATSLTAQVIIVLLLILAVWLLKQNNPEGYRGFRARYAELTTDPASFEGSFLATLEEYWKRVEGLVHLLPFTDGPAVDAPPQNALPSETQDGPAEGRREDLYEPGYNADISVPDIPAFDFDYLRPEGMGAGGGQGGLSPVLFASKRINLNEQLSPPANAVLSPVVLGAVMRPPVTGAVTSPFAWRYHPITDTTDFHTGMDIAAEEGRVILAALPGEVTEVGYSQIYGNYIVLKHATNLETFYAHCSEIIAREGMAIRQGERIAKVGSTGTVTGPHLHFSVLVEGVYTNPYWVLEDYIEILG